MKYFEIYGLLIIEQGVNEALQSVSNSGSPASTHRIMKRKKTDQQLHLQHRMHNLTLGHEDTKTDTQLIETITGL